MNDTPSTHPPVHLSVVIPAYNEAARIAPTLERVIAYLRSRDYAWEIIVVDDSSRDDTVAVVGGFQQEEPRLRLLQRTEDRGKGGAVRCGVLAAHGQFVLFSDADLSTPIEEVEKLLTAVAHEGYDVAIGSRALPQSELRVRQPWHREMLGRTFNLIVRAIAVHGFHDTQCGFKLFRAGVIDEIFSRQTINAWAFDVELLFIAVKRGLRIKEVPVAWVNSPQSKVDPVRDGLRMLRDMLGIRLRNLFGLYR